MLASLALEGLHQLRCCPAAAAWVLGAGPALPRRQIVGVRWAQRPMLCSPARPALRAKLPPPPCCSRPSSQLQLSIARTLNSPALNSLPATPPCFPEQKEADLAWKEKNVAQTKLNQLQHRANRLERENISLREQLHRLRRKMADAGQPALEQPAQQEGEAPPALSRAQHREQMQLRQEVRSLRQELRGSQEEASRLQARVAELEPEAAMMGDIRRQAQQGGSAAPPKQWRKWLLAAGVGAAVGFGIGRLGRQPALQPVAEKAAPAKQGRQKKKKGSKEKGSKGGHKVWPQSKQAGN